MLARSGIAARKNLTQEVLHGASSMVEVDHECVMVDSPHAVIADSIDSVASGYGDK